MKITRGLRNNNPLNIDSNADKFDGEIIPSQDSRFKQFKSIEYGYRAGFKILKTYMIKYNCDTITKIINRWAPPCENNTSAYIKTVATRTKIDPNSKLTIYNREYMCDIVEAMSWVENGVVVKREDIEKGYDLAFK